MSHAQTKVVPITVGVFLETVGDDLPVLLDDAVNAGFEFVAAPLFQQKNAAAISDVSERMVTCSDTKMSSARWTSCVVGAVSPWINVCAGSLHTDAASESERIAVCERALAEELSWASHLNVPAVIVPAPAAARPDAPLSSANYAAQLLRVLSAPSSSIHFWVRVPLVYAGAGAASATLVNPGSLYSREGNVAEGATASTGAAQGASMSATATAAGGMGDAIPWHTSPLPSANDGGTIDPVTESPPAHAGLSDAISVPGNSVLQVDSAWDAWNALRLLADSHPRLSIALELTAQLPPPGAMRRWLAEPVKAVVVPVALFISNAAGRPVLRRAHQAVLTALLGRPAGGPRVQLVLQPGVAAAGVDDAGTRISAAAFAPHVAYLQHLARIALPPASAVDTFLAPYVDVLQAPLQPLADNLPSNTYEVFESDPAKYDAYERAISDALRARWAAIAAHATADGVVAGSGERMAAAPTNAVAVLVVGAGRGPLVHRVLAASATTGVPVRVTAVEKNPNAVITLKCLARAEGWARDGRVRIVAGDMRVVTAVAEGSVDVIVSELLGSFGDNELSPECLDGAQRFLRRPVPSHSLTSGPAHVLPGTAPSPPPHDAGGVSIPAAYTSFLAPIHAPRLWNEARAFEAAGKGDPPGKWMATPYVVRMAAATLLGKPQAVFTFRHPNPALTGSVSHEDDDAGGSSSSSSSGSGACNRRYVSVRWSVPAGGGALVHGFAGYFEADLGGGVALSINPDTHTPGMFSWFPLYFPLREPVAVVPNDTIEVHMWRCVDGGRVWYEWALASPVLTVIHNSGGRCHSIGL